MPKFAMSVGAGHSAVIDPNVDPSHMYPEDPTKPASDAEEPETPAETPEPDLPPAEDAPAPEAETPPAEEETPDAKPAPEEETIPKSAVEERFQTLGQTIHELRTANEKLAQQNQEILTKLSAAPAAAKPAEETYTEEDYLRLIAEAQEDPTKGKYLPFAIDGLTNLRATKAVKDALHQESERVQETMVANHITNLWKETVASFPQVTDKTSPLYQRADQILGTFPASRQALVETQVLAIRKAARELNISEATANPAKPSATPHARPPVDARHQDTVRRNAARASAPATVTRQPAGNATRYERLKAAAMNATDPNSPVFDQLLLQMNTDGRMSDGHRSLPA